MNLPKLRPRPGAARRVLQGLSLLLVPGLAGENTMAISSPRAPGRAANDSREQESAPYLSAIGPPSLRFRALARVAEPVGRPVAIGPPIAGLKGVEVAVALANAAAARGPEAVAAGAPPAEARVSEKPAPTTAKPPPPAILPDDTRPHVRAEDFLPFFQIPGAAAQPGDVNVIVPLSRGPTAPVTPLPASSASYIQTPK